MARTGKNSRSLGLHVALWIGGLIFGLAFASVGLAIWSQSQPYADGVLTTGTVIDHQRSESSDSTTWASVVEFETEQREKITFVGSTFSYGQDPLGSEVRVSYQSENPFDARNLDDSGSTFGLIFVGIGSVVAMGAVIGMFLSAIKNLRSRVSGEQLQAEQARAAQWDSSGTDFIGSEDRGF